LDDRLAARVARACGLEHRLLRLGNDFFSDFASHVDRTVYITDGCLGVMGAHEIYLNEQARRLAPVRLTGNYGSEVLRGVSTLKPIDLSRNLFSPEFGHSLTSSPRSVVHRSEHAVTLAAFREIPWNLFGYFAADRAQVSFRTPYLDNRIVALAYRAPGSLRTSPLPAVSLVRKTAPFLYDIPTDMGEMGGMRGVPGALGRIFAKTMFKVDYLNNEGFPHWLSRLGPLLQRFAASFRMVGLHKYLHYRSWFQEELAGYLTGILEDQRVRQSPFWNSQFIEHIAREHIRGRKNYVREINAVLMIEAIERLFLRDPLSSSSGQGISGDEDRQREPASIANHVTAR
jgi:asparagine synthase (glutamine-hydrolysing)